MMKGHAESTSYRGPRNSFARIFRIPLILNFLAGHWFNVTPNKFRGVSNILAYCYIFIVNTLGFMYGILVFYNLLFTAKDFKMTIVLATGNLGSMVAISRTVFTTIYSKNIVKTILSFVSLMNNPFFLKQQKKMILKIKRKMKLLITLLLFCYISCLTLSFAIFYLIHENGLHGQKRQEEVPNVDDKSIKVIDLWTSVDDVVKEFPRSFILFYEFILFFTTCLSIGKVVASDVLFYSWYILIIEQLDLLVRGLDDCLRQDKHLIPWFQFQHQVNRLLTTVNSITTLCIVLSMIVNTLQMGIITYLLVKQLLDAFTMGTLFVFGLLSLLQAYMYCMLGQKIRERVSRLQNAAYYSSWQCSRRGTQHATLMICSAATERAMPLPGAPFFALSMEFFASLLGAVFTYFIVLMQMNH